MIELDLSTATLIYGAVYDSGTNRIGSVGGYSSFTFADQMILPHDAVTSFEIDVVTVSTAGLVDVMSLNAASDPDTSNWFDLSVITNPGAGQTVTMPLTTGPGIADFDLAIAAGEDRVLFRVGPDNYVTGVRWDPPAPEPLPRNTFGLVLDSSAVVNVTPPLSGGEVAPLHIIAPTVPVPTLVAGRPS